eukprot:2776221-Pyramimonas_sp.AAC.2
MRSINRQLKADHPSRNRSESFTGPCYIELDAIYRSGPVSAVRASCVDRNRDTHKCTIRATFIGVPLGRTRARPGPRA